MCYVTERKERQRYHIIMTNEKRIFGVFRYFLSIFSSVDKEAVEILAEMAVPADFQTDCGAPTRVVAFEF